MPSQDDIIFKETRSIKLGEIKLPKLFTELKEWINSKYFINVINIVYDKIDIGPHKDTPRLDIIVNSKIDYQKMFKKPFVPIEKYEKEISKRFIKSVKTAGLETNIHLDNLFVVYTDFSYIAMSKSCEQLLQNDKNLIKSIFADLNIWAIDGNSTWIVVFLRQIVIWKSITKKVSAKE
jgi:hypothetical protein